VVFRVWPGTQRLLAWGDPALAAGYGRSASFAGADGIEWMEPLTFKGRQGTGIAGGRAGYRDVELATRYDWEKYLLQYRLWGRLSFSPDAAPDAWRRYLSSHCGNAAGPVEDALSAASRILPLFTHAHGPSIANHNYWPEVYTNLQVIGDNHHRPFGDDMDGPLRFGNAPSFDSQMFANPREYVALLLAGGTPRSYTPLDVADWLEANAEAAEIAIARARSSSDAQRPAVRRLLIDAGIAAALGRFFAAKFRASCWAELFLVTHRHEVRERLLGALRHARDAWAGAASLAERYYPDDLTFGPGPHLRGSWQSRFAAIERELRDAVHFRFKDDDLPAADQAAALAVIAAIDARRPVRANATAPVAAERFTRGKPLSVQLTAAEGDEHVLHYRHVNQGERWQSMPMQVAGGRAAADIPAGYTDSPFHLQFYVSSVRGGETTLAPGFVDTLSNMPYCLAMQD
jgi:hypothetical protein